MRPRKGSKKALVWNEEADPAFEGMKKALLSAVGLHVLDPDRGFVVPTDASDYAIGTYWSKCLTMVGTCPSPSRAESWPKARGGPCEKEAYANVMALR